MFSGKFTFCEEDYHKNQKICIIAVYNNLSINNFLLKIEYHKIFTGDLYETFERVDDLISTQILIALNMMNR